MMMNPTTSSKFYNKLDNQIEDPQPTKKLLSKTTIIAVSSLLLLTLILTTTFIALVHETITESRELSLITSSSTESIKAVCSTTHHPTTCLSSILSLNASADPDPELIFKLSLQVCISHLTNLSSYIKTQNSNFAKTSSGGVVGALKDCEGLVDESLSLVNDSVVAMDVGPGQKVLTKRKVSDVRTWVSAAMTDQETCLDGLEEVGSTGVGELRRRVERAKECMSNSLAIVSNMDELLDKFELALH